MEKLEPLHSLSGNAKWCDHYRKQYGGSANGRNDAKAETPVLWPPDAKSWLIGKDYDAGRDWGQEEKGTTEDEMAGWHYRLDAREFGWTPGVGDGQGGLACCNSWGRKESDTTEQLNWTELNWPEVQVTTWDLKLASEVGGWWGASLMRLSPRVLRGEEHSISSFTV